MIDVALAGTLGQGEDSERYFGGAMMFMRSIHRSSCVRNVSFYNLMTSAAVVILIWILVVRQDTTQVVVRQEDIHHTQATMRQNRVSPTQTTALPDGILTTSLITTLSSTKITSSSSRHKIFMAPMETYHQKIVIKKYLDAEESRCRKKINHTTNSSRAADAGGRQQWCPCLPPDLHGRVMVSVNDDMSWEAIADAVGSDVLQGGEWKPSHCRSHTRMAIVIPCRDRDSHLRILLKHLIPILKRQLIHFRIFVLDQSHPAIFNKAAVMNVGFLEAKKRFQFDCILFHDVDHLLEDDRVLMNCGPEPHHYAIGIDAWDYRLLYGSVFGGVVTMTPEMFRKVNGFSIIYFGWGGEDDDMGSRVRRYWRVFRPPICVSRYTTLKHPRDPGNPRNDIRHRLMREEIQKYKKTSKIDNGLSNLYYKVTDTKGKQLFTWIQASINETMLPYPKLPVVRYRELAGICINPKSVMEKTDVSTASCRLRCDMLAAPRCFGYSYQHEVSPRCSLLRSACTLEKKVDAVTYVKL